MHEPIQPGERFAVGEHLRRDPLAIELAIGSVDVGAILGRQRRPHLRIAVRDRVPDLVGIEHARAGRDERARDRALAAPGTPDQAHDERARLGGAPGARESRCGQLSAHRTRCGPSPPTR